MINIEHLELRLVFSPTPPYPLEAIIVEGKRKPPPDGIRTRSEILNHYEQKGWRVVKSYSNVYALERDRRPSRKGE